MVEGCLYDTWLLVASDNNRMEPKGLVMKTWSYWIASVSAMVFLAPVAATAQDEPSLSAID